MNILCHKNIFKINQTFILFVCWLSITISFNKRLFWTDWTNGSIHTHDLTTNETREIIHIEKPVKVVPLVVHVWDERLQPPGDNPCKHKNGNCSHLCLLSNSTEGFTCACPTGTKLLTPTKCADEPQDMLFLVQRTQISRISLDSPDYTSFKLPLGRVKYAIAIDYDPVDDFIYWSDEEVHAIRRARHDGSGRMDIGKILINLYDKLILIIQDCSFFSFFIVYRFTSASNKN